MIIHYTFDSHFLLLFCCRQLHNSKQETIPYQSTPDWSPLLLSNQPNKSTIRFSVLVCLGKPAGNPPSESLQRKILACTRMVSPTHNSLLRHFITVQLQSSYGRPYPIIYLLPTRYLFRIQWSSLWTLPVLPSMVKTCPQWGHFISCMISPLYVCPSSGFLSASLFL